MVQVPVARHGVRGILWLNFMVRVTLAPANGRMVPARPVALSLHDERQNHPFIWLLGNLAQ